jgi:hypothetical protein
MKNKEIWNGTYKYTYISTNYHQLKITRAVFTKPVYLSWKDKQPTIAD